MKLSLFLFSFFTLSSFAQSQGSMDGYLKCMDDHKKLRSSHDKNKEYTKYNTQDEYYNSGSNFKVTRSFGDGFREKFSDQKVTDVCLNAQYQQDYDDIFKCMNNFTYENYSGDKFTFNKTRIYEYCTENFKSPQKVEAVGKCITDTEEKLQFVRKNKFKIIWTSPRRSNYMLEYCEDKNYQEYISELNREKLDNCYSLKLDVGHYNNDFVIKPELYKLILSSIKSGELNAKVYDEINKPEDKKTEVRTSLKNYYKDTKGLHHHHAAFGLAVMKDCSDEEIAGRKLYEFYNQEKFRKCLSTMNNEMSIKTREGICAPLTEFEQIDQTQTITGSQTSSASNVNDDDPSVDSISDFWDWIWGEGKFEEKPSSGAVGN